MPLPIEDNLLKPSGTVLADDTGAAETALRSTRSNSSLIEHPADKPVPAGSEVRGLRSRHWPALTLTLAVIACGAGSIKTAVDLWSTDDSYSHGFLLPIISGLLIWTSRDRLKNAERIPNDRGLYLLFGALVLQAAAHLLVIKVVGVWAFVLSLTGTILWLYGMPVWRVVQFPVLFLLFGAPVPNSVLHHLIGWLQSVSTVWAADLSGWAGFPIVRQGNLIQTPGLVLEVADVCSGYHKLIALVALATLYGYLTRAPLGWRFALIAAGLPIALCTNAVRIATIVGIGYEVSPKAALIAHPYLDYFALALSFAMFAGIGKLAAWKENPKQ